MDKEQVKKEILAMYKDALEDATMYYKSDYSCSSSNDKKRDEEDMKLIHKFKALLKLL